MDKRVSKVNWGTGELEFNKQALVEASANLYRWGGKDALLRLRKVIDEALETAAKQTDNSKSMPLRAEPNVMTCKYCGREIDFGCPNCE